MMKVSVSSVGEAYLFIHLSPCSLHSPDPRVLHFPSPFNQPHPATKKKQLANHVSAVKLETTLLSAVSCHVRHLCDPPPPHPPPTLHIQLRSPESTPPLRQIYRIFLPPSQPPVSRLQRGGGVSYPRHSLITPLNITLSRWSLTAKTFSFFYYMLW